MPQLGLDLTNPPLATIDADTVAEPAQIMPRLKEADVRAVIFTGGVEG